jgi:hypothetical protein
MALVLADRVLETTTSTGSGTITLAGAEPGYQSFSAVGDGNQTYYTIAGDVEWEVGVGTYTASGTTLSRDTVLSSSAGGAKVTFSAGSKKVFVTYPSEKSVNFDVSGNISVSSAIITDVAEPVVGSDAATKLYVDTLAAQGISYHEPVKYEVPNTTGNLVATYNNGTAGVSATLTNAGTLAAFVPDGVTASISDRVLVYNQTNAYENGVYVVSTVGNGSTAWVLTRAADADSYGVKSPTELGTGDAFYVSSGNTGAGETYVCNTPGVIVFGSTAITFAQISSAQVYQAGNGISLTNTVISLATPVSVTNGGTGTSATPTNGQLLIGNGSDYSLSTLTAGSGISITNSAGSITLSATNSGAVTSVTASGPLASSGGATPNISIANSTGTGSVVLQNDAAIFSATITGAVSASITTITGTSANITTVTGTTAGFSSANITQLGTTSATIATLSGTNVTYSSGTVSQLAATSATIGTVSGTNVSYANGNLTSATVTTISGTTATYTSATVTNLALTSLTLANLSITSANVTTLTGTNLTYTSGTVTNLNSTSANITTLTGTTFGTTATTHLRGASAAITALTGTNLSYGSATITTGNLAFTGTAQRITGDMSNATITNRVLFETSTANSTTEVGIIPSGSGGAAVLNIYPVSNPSDTGYLRLASLGTDSRILSQRTGTGTFLPLTFYTGGSERVRIDTSGNVGIGATPLSNTRLTVSDTNTIKLKLTGGTAQNALAFEPVSGTNQYSIHAGNSLLAGGDKGFMIYDNTNGRAKLFCDDGTGETRILGTTFSTVYANGSERMRINSSGNVGIGTASPSGRLHVSAGTQTALNLQVATGGYAWLLGTSGYTGNASVGFIDDGGSGGLGINQYNASGSFVRRAITLDTNGNVGIGTSSPTNFGGTNLNVTAANSTVYASQLWTSGAYVLEALVNESSAVMSVGSRSNHKFDICTNDTTRISITNTGNVQINTSLGVGTAGSGTTGEIRATNNITAYYSDARLKDFKGKIGDALYKVSQLNGYYYTENEKAEEFGYNNKELQVGVSAQEVQAVLPEVIAPAPFDMNENNESKSGENYMTVRYEKLVPLLIEAIKELKAEVEALKAGK